MNASRWAVLKADVLPPSVSSRDGGLKNWLAVEFLLALNTVQQGRLRVDQMEKCRHYQHWRDDFDCVQALGLHFLRHGVPLHRVSMAANKHDWEFSDETFGEINWIKRAKGAFQRLIARKTDKSLRGSVQPTPICREGPAITAVAN